MTVETFFEKFELFADVPGVVTKMRELVLELAVRGKLVEQDDADGDAGVLLNRIMDCRQRKHHRKFSEVTIHEDSPTVEGWYEVPRSWRWVRLSMIGDIVGGGTPRSDNSEYFTDEGIPWLTPADLNGFKGKRISRGRRFITKLGLERSSAQLLSEGSVLFSSRAPIGYVAIAGAELATNQGFKSCVPFVTEINEFLYYYLLNAAARIDREASGTTFREVSGKVVSQIPVPLPPLAEQKRIVAKVDELMALCDRLEAEQKEREEKKAALTRASLARFSKAPTPANLNYVFHKSYDITPADLSKTILTLAVQGKLVPQDPNDEPAEYLLARTDQRRYEKALIDHRADTESQPLLSVDARWITPDTWSWRGLADLVLFVDYRGKTPEKLAGGVRLITAKNVRKGNIDLFPEEFISEGEYEVWMTRGFPEEGDVLFTTEAPMGNAAVVDLKERFALAQRVICFQSYGAIDPTFLVIQILSDQFQFILNVNATGVTAKGIKASKLKQIPITVPPLAEQRRIVAKVGQLISLVDVLEEQLAASCASGEKLLVALVAELTTLRKAPTTP